MHKATKRKLDEDMEESDTKDELDTSKTTQQNLFCDWCKVQMPNEASMKQHLLGQKHKKFHDAEEDRKRVEQKCGLFIRGYPPTVTNDAILTYFLKFGKIMWVHFDHSFLLLDYSEPSVAENVINKAHYLGRKRLMIKYRHLRKQATVVQPQREENNRFIQNLKDVPDFDFQVEMLKQNLQPAAHQQFPKYNRVCEDLHNALQHSFPYCRIHPFGSTITGLDFNNSDIDVFISGVRTDSNEIPFLYTAKRMLLNSRLFTNTLVIPQAKIPILKCVHIQTGINCDINLKNMLGVCNSEMIIYYINLDPKLRNLLIILKYWAKTHKITGQNHLFTNYSLNLMLIFFLQHAPFQFPSVLMLQQNPQYFNNQDGWNGGIELINYCSLDLYDMSLLSLLAMFFHFYINFEYGVNVICPYLGHSVKKQEFKDPQILPDYYYTYKQFVAITGQHLKVDTAVCIQDPFEHSRNTTPMVSLSTLEMFVSFCRLGKKICDEKGPILFRLLTEVPPNLASLTTIKSQSSEFTIPMRPGMKYIEGKHKTSSERQKEWFKNMVKFTKIVLEDFLGLNLTEVSNSASRTKHKKVEGQTDVYDETTHIYFKCSGKLNLWNARKSVLKNKKPEENDKKSVVEKERAITEELRNLYKDINLAEDIINFELSLKYVVDPPKVVVNIQKISAYKNSFKTFATFFSANLPAWFKTFEQEQNDNIGN